LEFAALFLVMLVAFSSGFHALFKDPAGKSDHALLTGPLFSCQDYDLLYESWLMGATWLFETMLAGAGDTHCYRASSQPVIGTLLSYAFMLNAVIMLVNFLIATMAKTIDNYHGSSSHYLFVRARTTSIEMRSWPALPPLNLLSLPYQLYVAFKGFQSLELSERNRFAVETSTEEEAIFWKGSASLLTDEVHHYVMAHRGEAATAATSRVSNSKSNCVAKEVHQIAVAMHSLQKVVAELSEKLDRVVVAGEERVQPSRSSSPITVADPQSDSPGPAVSAHGRI